MPLYFLVGSTLAGAAFYLTTNRATHPMVEGGSSKRQDGLPQEHPNAAEEGRNHFESGGRQLTKKIGLIGGEHEGEPQHTDGIFKNKMMSKMIEGTALDTGDSKITKPKA
jgi:hypothetical protein